MTKESGESNHEEHISRYRKRRRAALRAIGYTKLTIINQPPDTPEEAIKLAYSFAQYSMYERLAFLHLTQNQKEKNKILGEIVYYHEILTTTEEHIMEPLKGFIGERHMNAEKESNVELRGKYKDGLYTVLSAIPDTYGMQLEAIPPPWEDEQFAV